MSVAFVSESHTMASIWILLNGLAAWHGTICCSEKAKLSHRTWKVVSARSLLFWLTPPPCCKPIYCNAVLTCRKGRCCLVDSVLAHHTVFSLTLCLACNYKRHDEKWKWKIENTNRAALVEANYRLGKPNRKSDLTWTGPTTHLIPLLRDETMFSFAGDHSFLAGLNLFIRLVCRCFCIYLCIPYNNL